MLNPTYCAVLASLVLMAVGCAQGSDSDKLTPDTPLQFELSAEPQTAVFRTERGWTGGMGDPVLLEKRRQVRVNGLRVVLAYGTMSMIEQAIEKEIDLPDDCVRNEKIVVKARVHLEKRAERNSSIEGIHRETIYRLFVDELIDVLWTSEPCD